MVATRRGCSLLIEYDLDMLTAIHMYVMGSIPEQQSLAGGISNTITRICGNLPLGISTAIYISFKQKANATTTDRVPYLFTFRFTAVTTGIPVFLIPFVKIGKQDGPAIKTDH